MVRSRLLVAPAVAALLVLASCQSPPPESNTGGEELANEPTTIMETPLATVEAPGTMLPEGSVTPATVIGTPSPALSPTPSTPAATPTMTPTPQPPSAAVRSSAQSLSTKLTAFRAALRSQNSERAASLQLELLSEAQKAEAALQQDTSEQAAQVRDAIADIRDGATGNTQSLDQAVTTLRGITGFEAGGTPLAGTGTPMSGLTSETEAGEPMLELQERLADYQKAKRDQNTENILRTQAALVEALSAAESATHGNDSQDAQSLREAIANINKGLQGDSEALAKGAATLNKVVGPIDQSQNPEEGDVTKAADAISQKLATLRQAVASNNPQEVLRQQRELTDEVDKAEKALESDSSPDAEKLRSAIGAVRGGLGGDRAKLDGAATQLREVARGSETTSEAGDASGSSSAEPVDPEKAASKLQDQVKAMQRAIDKGNTDDMMRAQRDLLQTVEQVEPSVRDSHGGSSDNLRAALEAIRNGLAGDTGKFDDAAQRLTLATGEQSDSGDSTTGSSSGTPSARQVDPKPMADHIAGTLNKVSEAKKKDDPEALAEARSAAEADLDKLAAELPNDNSQNTQRIKQVLDEARGALAGDQTKLDAAQRALEQLRQ